VGNKRRKNHANNGTVPSLQHFTKRGDVQSTEEIFRPVPVIFNTPVKSLSVFYVSL
jgi:hypothetical protein